MDRSTTTPGVLSSYLREALTGPAVAIVVAGDPGTGRTRLLDEVVAAATSWRVVRVASVGADRDLGYGGLVVLLHRLGSTVPALRPDCAQLSARIAAGVEPAGPLRWFDQVLDLLSRAAAEAPLLVVVDDADHLDAASADVLVQVARAAAQPGLAIVLDGDDDPRFVAAGLRRLEVDAVTAATAAEVVEERTGRAPAVAVVDALLGHVRGNVTRLVEVATQLTDAELAGWAALPDPLPAASGAVPPVVDDLPPATGRALVVAALATATHPQVVARAIELAGGSFADLEPAEAQELVHLGPQRVTFPRSMLRSGLAARATAGERRTYHGYLSVAISERAPAERLARVHHLAAASLISDAELVTSLLEVAATEREDGDLRTSVHATAEAAYRGAPGDTRAELLLLAAERARHGGLNELAARLLDAAFREAVEAQVRARARTARDQSEVTEGSPVAALVHLLARADATAPTDPAAAAELYVTATGAAVMCGRMTDAGAAAARGVELAEPGTVIAAAAGVWAGVCQVLNGQLLHGLASVERHLPDLRGDGAEELVTLTRTMAMAARLWCDEVAAARSGLVDIVAELDSVGANGLLPFPLATLALAEHRRGWWDAAVAHGTRSVALAEATGQQPLLGHAHVALALITAARGDVDACRDHVRALRSAARHGPEPLLAYAAAAEGSLELGRGDPEAAVHHLEEARRLAHANEAVTPSVLGEAGDLLQAYVEVGRHADAATHCRALEVRARTQGDRWSEAVAHRGRALLGDRDAERHLEHALRGFARSPAPFEEARTQLVAATWHAASGRADAARRAGAAARTVFSALGAVPWLERVEVVLASAEVARDEGEVFASLSAQERRVATLVAEGASNRDVAEALVLSVKTVEFHLHNVYRKLRISSRAQLIRLAIEGEADTHRE